jgi:hypothetical protein
MGRRVSRTTSSSVGSCFLAVSDSLLNADPTAAFVVQDGGRSLRLVPVPRAFHHHNHIAQPITYTAMLSETTTTAIANRRSTGFRTG